VTFDRTAAAQDLVDHYLSDRLSAPATPPGLRDAATQLTAAALGDATFERLIRAQLGQLRSSGSSEIPDAYLADESACEDALQHSAAGLRSALAPAGVLVHARSFEQQVASIIASNPRLALRAELARVPRPLDRPEDLSWSAEPAPWAREREPELAWPPDALSGIADRTALTGGPDAFARVVEGPHSGWIQVAFIERHRTPARRYPERPTRTVLIAVGMEIGEPRPASSPMPFASSPWDIWVVESARLDPTLSVDQATRFLATQDVPGFARPSFLGPSKAGLGLPPFLLVPVFPLIVALGLAPTAGICGFSLGDEAGPGIVGRHWRGHLVHDGNYSPLIPAVEGTDILMRPDLFSRLLSSADPGRIHAGLRAAYSNAAQAIEEEV